MIHTIIKDKQMHKTLIDALDNDLKPILNTKTIYNKKRLYEAYKDKHTYQPKRFQTFLKVYLKMNGYKMIKETNETFKIFDQNILKF